MCKKILFVLIIFFSSSVLASCFFFEDCKVPRYFQINGLDSYIMRLTNEDNEDNNPWEVLPANESIDWDEFFIRFYFDVSYLSKSNVTQGGPFLLADCYEPGDFGAKTGIDTLYFITLSDYNQNFSEGDTLNQILLLHDWVYSPNDFNNFQSPAEFIRRNDKVILEENFEVILSEPPAANGNYIFQMLYILDDGTAFIETTVPVMINIE